MAGSHPPASLAVATVWAPRLSVGLAPAFTFALGASDPGGGDAASVYSQPSSLGQVGARCASEPSDPGALLLHVERLRLAAARCVT